MYFEVPNVYKAVDFYIYHRKAYGSEGWEMAI